MSSRIRAEVPDPFVWEGDSYYLTEQAVDDTLLSVRRNAGVGSVAAYSQALPEVIGILQAAVVEPVANSEQAKKN